MEMREPTHEYMSAKKWVKETLAGQEVSILFEEGEDSQPLAVLITPEVWLRLTSADESAANEYLKHEASCGCAVCEEPDDNLYLHAECHVENPSLCVRYSKEHHTITLECPVCEKEVATLELK